MITRLFSKSKPINYTIVMIYVILVFVLYTYNNFEPSLNNVLQQLLNLILVLSLFPLLHYLIKTNTLTKRHSFSILLFALLIGMFPNVLTHFQVLISNIMLLYALRRMLSLQDNKNTKKKLFDAAFSIALATLFFSWAILFFFLLLTALAYYSKGDIKNWVITLTAVITVVILLICFNILFNDCYIKPSNFNFNVSFDYTIYNSKANILKFTILLSSIIWAMVHFFQMISERNKKQRFPFILMTWTMFISLVVVILCPNKNQGEILFLFVPFSIIMANYLQSIPEHWLREIFVFIFVAAPIIGLAL